MANGDATLSVLGTFKTHYGFKIKPFTVTCVANYATGGYHVDLSTKGVDTVWAVLITSAAEQHPIEFQYDAVAKKITAFVQDADGVADSALVELANAASLSVASTFELRVLLIGSGK